VNKYCDPFRVSSAVSDLPQRHKRNRKKNVLQNGTKGRWPRFFFLSLSLSLIPSLNTNRVDVPVLVTLGHCQTLKSLNTVLFCRCVLRVFQSIAYHRLLCGAQGRFFFYFFSVVFFLVLCYYCSSFSFDFCFSDKIVSDNISY